MSELQQLAIKVSLPPTSALPPAEGANYFHIAFVSDEVQLLVGSINLADLHEAAQGQLAELSVTPNVAHRYLLSVTAFERLRANVETIYAAIQGLKAKGAV